MRSFSAALKRRLAARWVTCGSGRSLAGCVCGTSGECPFLAAVFMCVSNIGRRTVVFLLRPDDLHNSPYGDLSHPIVAHRETLMIGHVEFSYTSHVRTVKALA